MQDTYNEVRNAFVNRQESMRQNALAAQQDTAKQAAGQQFAGGDLTGASNTLAASGNIAGAQQVQTYSDAQRQQHAQAAQRISKGIRAAVNAGHTPAEAFDMATQVAPNLGIDPAELQRMRPAYDKDPRAFLDFVDQQAAKELQVVNRGNGGYDVVDMKTGDKVRGIDPQPEQKYVPVPEGGKLVPVPRGDAPPTLATAPQADPAAAVAGLTSQMGATITSGARTPAHNAEVGGVPTSRHLTDQARDIVPPAGMTLAQLGAAVQQQIPGAKVIVEKDHVHVQWGGAQAAAPAGGDPAGTVYGNPKPKARIATSAEKAAYGIPENVPAQIKPDGSMDVISGSGANLKPVPAQIQKGLIENRANARQIDQAIAAVQQNPGALGLKNVLGENINQRIDPGGINTRASVANIGSLIIHDRSGAAVTVNEFPRLKPFIPTATDTPDAAVKKLKLLRQNIDNLTTEMELAYGEDSGYRPMGGEHKAPTSPTSSAAPPPAGSAPPAAKGVQTPPASTLQAGHITTFANGQRWTLRGSQPVRVQ